MAKNFTDTQSSPDMQLGICGFTYADLYSPEKLAELLQEFDRFLAQQDPELLPALNAYRAAAGDDMRPQEISDILLKTSPWVAEFIARIFQIQTPRDDQISAIQADNDDILRFRKGIVIAAQKRYKQATLSDFDIQQLNQQIDGLKQAIPAIHIAADAERHIAHIAARLLDLAEQVNSNQTTSIDSSDPITDLRAALTSDAKLFSAALSATTDDAFITSLISLLQAWAWSMQQHPEHRDVVQHWPSFKLPQKVNFNELVEHQTTQHAGYTSWQGTADSQRQRDGFTLTDKRYNQRQAQYEVQHCIYCHDRDTDSCSKGMRNKKSDNYKVNALGVTVTGCPLCEKISEMHVLKGQGDNIAALALVMVDNPMCPGTGHRICNDCMKGCIYQKTEPVNIPQIETQVLTDVLSLPYGFEIYGLLTRWNPLNIQRPHALPYNGKNILVVGMGPAGYTLAHYLLNEGFSVTGIDALKIEPLDPALTGSSTSLPAPVQDFATLYQDLDERLLMGFGGVAEYGITARWDKNFLLVIYLTLARRQTFRCFGGVRFGGTLNIEDAWSLGFDHIALATGAGKPTIIGLKNNLIRGIRKASDFLMALQLTGAAKKSSLANLQLRLPAGVIGGGLTAIDTTTEAMAYYPVQVEKILHRYNILVEKFGATKVRAEYDIEELEILDEFLTHGKAIRAERERAKAAGEQPDFTPLVQQWGGVTLFYRKGIQDSPAYRQNHEEIRDALQEGIQLAEGMSPAAAIADEYGAIKAVTFERLEKKEGQWLSSGEMLDIPLKSLFVAAGTSPNVIYEQEYPYSFRMDEKFFQRHEPHWNNKDKPELIPINDTALPKISKPAPFTSYEKNGKYISFYGDNHPVYAGNVVKAMASAKDGYPYIVRLFANVLNTLGPNEQAARDKTCQDFFKKLHGLFSATVHAINRLTPTIVEVIVKAPLQAEKFEPGQFYRVQNMEAYAPTIADTVLAAEGLALTGAWVDKELGLISLISLEMGSSSKLCALWKAGDPLVVMGVTGTPTEIPSNKTVLLIGGGLGNAVQFSIGKALRATGNKVIYFAGYRNPQDVFKVEEIEAASDIIVWAVDKAPDIKAIPTTRAQDKTFVGNMLQAIEAYATGALGETNIALSTVDHMIVIGSDKMMAAVKEARHTLLKPYLQKNHVAIGSINSPMQCMMKGVCAQCLCKHIDPHTGEEYFVYSCYNQDQELDRVDFNNLNARLRQNSVQEKLSNKWLDHLLDRHTDT